MEKWGKSCWNFPTWTSTDILKILLTSCRKAVHTNSKVKQENVLNFVVLLYFGGCRHLRSFRKLFSLNFLLLQQTRYFLSPAIDNHWLVFPWPDPFIENEVNCDQPKIYIARNYFWKIRLSNLFKLKPHSKTIRQQKKLQSYRITQENSLENHKSYKDI